MNKTVIKTEYIKADSMLKLIGCAGSGGEAKRLFSEGLVKVNGVFCAERGKKLRKGDILEVNGKEYVIVKEYP